jgi:hypothetical protein
MAEIVLETDVCVEGFLYDIVEDTSIQMLSGPNLNGLNGLMNGYGNSMLQPIEDPDGDLTLPLAVQSDPDWMDIGVIKNSKTNKSISSFFLSIKANA